jgi:hypothetical protein
VATSEIINNNLLLNSTTPSHKLRDDSVTTTTLSCIFEELICKIFSHLTPAGIRALAPTCRRFLHISKYSLIPFLRLDRELEEKITLSFDELIDYQTEFEKSFPKQVFSFSQLFAKCPHLTILNLSHSPIGKGYLSDILNGACKTAVSWHHLDLSSCWNLVNVIDLNPFEKLEVVYVRNCVQIRALYIDRLASLRILDVSSCTKLEGTFDVNRFPKLQKLSVRNTKLTVLHGPKQLPLLKALPDLPQREGCS